jgi:hypothetical protein
MKGITILLMIVAGFGFASTLLENGAFEQDLSIGWHTFTFSALDTIKRGTGYDNDPDYELFVYRDFGSGYCKAWQTIDIPTTDLSFSVNAKLWAYDNDADTLCWAAAAIQVFYLDQAGSILGETRIYFKTSPCPWVSSPTLHLVEVTDDLWHAYSFNVNSELTNLPGVSPSAVKQIQVAAFDTTAHTC